MTERRYLVLKLHRERVLAATNFIEFRIAQVNLLDWMLSNYEHREQVDIFTERRLQDIDEAFMGGPIS